MKTAAFAIGGLGGARCIETRLTCYLTAAHAKVARKKARSKGQQFEPESLICRSCGYLHNVPIIPEFAWPTIAVDQRGRTTCVDTGKRCFDSEESAAAERKRTRRQACNYERSIRSYLCPHCELWHNTSKEAWPT